MLRKAPVGVELARDDIGTATVARTASYRITAKNATPAVTVDRQPGRAHHVGDGPHGPRRGCAWTASEAAVTKLAEANW